MRNRLESHAGSLFLWSRTIYTHYFLTVVSYSPSPNPGPGPDPPQVWMQSLGDHEDITPSLMWEFKGQLDLATRFFFVEVY